MELSKPIPISEFLEELTKTSQDAITITDLEGRVLSCNAVAECLYGCSADDMAGRYFASVWTNISADDLRTRANELVRGVGADEFYGELRAGTFPCERSASRCAFRSFGTLFRPCRGRLFGACSGRKSDCV
jgi:PAS domain S-box-containing protein